MLKGSAPKHILGAGHLSVVDVATAASQLAAENENRLQGPYSDPLDAYINPSAGMDSLEPRAGIFDRAILDDMDTMPYDHGNEYSGQASSIIPVGILPESDNTEQERLRLQVQALLMQAEQDDEFRGLVDPEDDSTVTNIVQQFRLLGTYDFMASDLI